MFGNPHYLDAWRQLELLGEGYGYYLYEYADLVSLFKNILIRDPTTPHFLQPLTIQDLFQFYSHLKRCKAYIIFVKFLLFNSLRFMAEFRKCTSRFRNVVWVPYFLKKFIKACFLKSFSLI